MNVTDPFLPPFESCTDAPSFSYPVAPAALLQSNTDGRLLQFLRDAAATQDPIEILTRAALEFLWARHPIPLGPPATLESATALADLAVSGGNSFARFFARQPDDATVAAAVRARLGTRSAAEGDLSVAVGAALDRAYAVANALRGAPALRAATRPGLGWIAVSAEDDPPHRPVNVPSAPYPQYDIPVTVHGIPVQARCFVASARPLAPAATPPARTVFPDERLQIDGDRVLLFIHGHSSSAEEALGLIPEIQNAGRALGFNLTVISVDLPSNGYSTMVEHTLIAPSNGTSWPALPTDHSAVRTPILTFIEDFLVGFVDELDRQSPFKSRFGGVIGGSLGGNMGLRLGRRSAAECPWLAAGIVSWDPASVWDAMVQDLAKMMAPHHCQGHWDQVEGPSSRADHFHDVYESPIYPLPSAIFGPIPTQPDMWYSPSWPCKAQHILGSRLARREIYNSTFRRWHWRVAGEQLIYSHVDRVDHENAATPFRYQQNYVRQLLIAGADDNFPFANIYDATGKLARRMGATPPGRSLFLLGTGHSVHTERPRYLAGQIVSFLTTEAGVRPPFHLPSVPIVINFPPAQAAAWQSVSGVLTTSPVAFTSPNGVRNVFAGGLDGHLWSFQPDAAGGGVWGQAAQVPGRLTGRVWPMADAAGRLCVYAVDGTGAIWSATQNVADGPLITGSGFGGALVGEASACANSDGRIEVLARYQTDALYHYHQDVVPWPPHLVYGQSLEGTLAGSPIVARNADGRLEVFARFRDNTLQHRVQTAAGQDRSWTPWEQFGSGTTADPTVGVNADGRLELFVVAGGYVWQRWQVAASGGWSSWVQTSVRAADNARIAVARNSFGGLEAFVRAPDNTLWTAGFRPGPTWTPWSSLGGHFETDPTACATADGRVEVYALGTDQSLVRRWQLTPGGEWNR